MAIYYLRNQVTTANNRFSLDIANAILKGEIDTHSLVVFTEGAGDVMEFGGTRPVLELSTDVIPENALDSQRIYTGQGDSDTVKYIPTFDKVRAGNFFVTSVQAVEDFANALNEVRKICDDVKAILHVPFTNSDTTAGMPFVSTANTVEMVVYGTLKETQTQDYNPLDQVTAPYKRDYVMLSYEEISTGNAIKTVIEDNPEGE